MATLNTDQTNESAEGLGFILQRIETNIATLQENQKATNTMIEDLQKETNTKIDNLQEKIEEMSNQVKAGFDKVEFRFGKTASKIATVGISSQNDAKDFSGRGTVVFDKTREKYYLLSAAHVLIPLVNKLIRKNPKTFHLHSFNGVITSVTIGNALWISDEYILSGHADVALLELEEDFSGLDHWSFFDGATIDNDLSDVGETVIARGNSLVFGAITMQNDDFRHFTVTGHCKRENSGAPVFNNEKRLVGLIHGSSKLRGRHNANSQEDAAIAHCHGVKSALLKGLRRVVIDASSDAAQLLEYAEDVPLEVAKNKLSLPEFLRKHKDTPQRTSLKALIKALTGDSATPAELHEIMHKLQEHIANKSPDKGEFEPNNLKIWKCGQEDGD